MERVISQDERIRRAEEIYARRKMQNESRRSATVNVDSQTGGKLTKKLIKQFVVCSIIYISFYAITNSPNMLSKEVMYKVSDILEYDINIQEVYNNINSYINKQEIENAVDENKEETEAVEQIESNKDIENTALIEETLSASEIVASSEIVEEKVEEAVETVEVTEKSDEVVEATEKTQMELDAEFIKANYSIIKPLEGEITSRFGLRNPTVPTVPKNHTGIDIARGVGTIIISAMDGTVELVSSEGDYGNHVKITNGELSTLYAHCSKIYVTEGETIVQGQQIAEVGATGNVTGPHLHFEIRRNNQYINPDLILQF